MVSGGRLRSQWDWWLGTTLVAAAAIMLVVAWVGVSGARAVSDQLAWIVSLGLGAIVLLGAGSFLLVTAGLSDEWRKLDRLADALALPSGDDRRGAGAVLQHARLVAGAGLAAATAFLAVATARAAGEADPRPGFEALSVGVFGVLVGGLAAAVAVLSVQKGIQLRKRRLFAPWITPAPVPASSVPGAASGEADGSVLVAAGLSRFHREGCPALGGLSARRVDRLDIPLALEPCELCDAEETASREVAGTWT